VKLRDFINQKILDDDEPQWVWWVLYIILLVGIAT
jgi:hypothetical protein